MSIHDPFGPLISLRCIVPEGCRVSESDQQQRNCGDSNPKPDRTAFMDQSISSALAVIIDPRKPDATAFEYFVPLFSAGMAH